MINARFNLILKRNNTNKSIEIPEMATELNIPEDSPLYNPQSRQQSFRETTIINNRKFKWRYQVIPYQSMAQLGFFFHPFKDTETNQIRKDAVGCIFCHSVSFDFSKCRSSKKNRFQTLINVLERHLHQTGNRCLNAHIRLRLIQHYQDKSLIDDSAGWIPKGDTFLNDPFSVEMLKWRSSLLLSVNFSKIKWSKEDMISSGLVPYDTSLSGFKILEDIPEEKKMHNETFICIYCQSVVVYDESFSSPSQEHYKICKFKGKTCHFFQETSKPLESVELIPNENEKEQSTSPKSTLRSIAPIEPEETKLERLPSRTPSPIRKKRKLGKVSTKVVSLSENEESSSINTTRNSKTDKVLKINFEDHAIRQRENGQRKNPILDDSTNDDISFSNQGHSTFDIPLPTSSILPSRDSQSPLKLTSPILKIDNIDNVQIKVSPSSHGQITEDEIAHEKTNHDPKHYTHETHELEQTELANNSSVHPITSLLSSSDSLISPAVMETNRHVTPKLHYESNSETDDSFVPSSSSRSRHSQTTLETSSSSSYESSSTSLSHAADRSVEHSNPNLIDNIMGASDEESSKNSNIEDFEIENLGISNTPSVLKQDPIAHNDSIEEIIKYEDIESNTQAKGNESTSNSTSSSTLSTPVASPKKSPKPPSALTTLLSTFPPEVKVNKPSQNNESSITVKTEVPSSSHPSLPNLQQAHSPGINNARRRLRHF